MMNEDIINNRVEDAKLMKKIWEIISQDPELANKLSPGRKRQLEIILKNEKRTHKVGSGESTPWPENGVINENECDKQTDRKPGNSNN